METVSEALRRLESRGFVRQLVVDGDDVVSASTGERCSPDDLRVVDVVRFEGSSDPDDEAIVLAVGTSDHEPFGTLTTAFGAYTSAEEAEVLHRLRSD